MANALLDAIKQMKAKRVAIVVGDADELGLPDMVQGVDGDNEMPAEDDAEPMMEDDNEAPEDPNEIPDTEDMAENEDGLGEGMGEAEKVMGRKPFDKNKPAGQAAAGSDDDGVPDAVGKDLFDEDMVNKMRASGKKPNGLMARAQMNLAKRFGK